jgi:hypothetical protein
MNTLNIKGLCKEEYSKITPPLLRTYDEKRQIINPYFNSTIFNEIKSHSLWKRSQSSTGEADWTSYLLSLQLSN